MNEKYIPKNLEESFVWLDENLEAKDKEYAKDNFKFGVEQHHTFGRHLRNDWGLWSGSELKSWFNGLGINHADDMTEIIFDSYHSYLNGEDIRLDEQIKHYQNYWENIKEDE